jgi:DNA ligase-1
MRQFAELFEELDATTSINEKLAALVRYFGSAPAEDAAWAAYFLSGRRLKRIVGPATLREWLMAETGMPEWLLDETYAEVGDLAETIALLIDASASAAREDLSLAEWIDRLLSLPGMTSEQQRKAVTEWWKSLAAEGRFLLNKVLTGELRVGVSSGLVERALAQLLGLPRPVIAHRLTGTWQPSAQFWAALNAPDGEIADNTRPYPFCLASPLEQDPGRLGAASDWFVEWKWDGIRAQVMRRAQAVYIWSRGEELITERFPEIVQRTLRLPADTVIDGEILAWREGQVQSFADLQQRIGRKSLSAKIVAGTPVRFLAYDLLELEGADLRARPLRERRALLERLLADFPDTFDASEVLRDYDWEQLQALRETSRQRRVEGMMLKHSESLYVAGRQRGTWWKWKVDPYTFDGVLIYAEPGRGRRANLLTDYTFAVRDGDTFVPVAKAYSGLSDSEIARVDRWIRQNTLERFGPVRAVRPQLVFEIAFEGIAASTRHKSGVAVRFPRIARWRADKPAEEANTIQDLRDILANIATERHRAAADCTVSTTRAR